MQHQSQGRHPPPDIGLVPLTAATGLGQPSFTIIALFALRLAKQLIQGLDSYPGQYTDLTWLTNFLDAYHVGYAFAKISGPQKDDYVVTYPSIVSRMKKQRMYPKRFMQMHPDQAVQAHLSGRGAERTLEMSDGERLAIIDFSDAAREWGSVVPIPAREADRMIELANQRPVADPDAWPPMDKGRAFYNAF